MTDMNDVSQEVVKEQLRNLKMIISSVRKENIEDVQKYLNSVPKVSEFQIKAIPTMLSEAMKLSIEKKNLEISKILMKDSRIDFFTPPLFCGYCLFVDACINDFSEIIPLILQREEILDPVQVNKGIEFAAKNNFTGLVLEILKEERVKVCSDSEKMVKEMEEYESKKIGNLLEERIMKEK